MKYFLGLSTHLHDSAAAIVCDGEIIAAAQEERFSRLKHDSSFPAQAIAYCLGEAFIEPSEIEAIVFHEDPILHLDRFLSNALTVSPRGREVFIAGCESLLGVKARVTQDVEACLGEVPPLRACGHHLSHAASAFYPSPFSAAAILTLDGVGEWATCTVGRGFEADIEVVQELRYPHSIGLLYSAFTQFCGFKVNSGEYKLMGLAPYGVPRYADLIRNELVDIREDGSLRLNTSAFGFLDSRRMIGPAFETMFEGPARNVDERLTRREMDLAASVQLVVEEIILKLARTALKTAGSRNLVLAGGVALNCVANGRVQRELDVDGLFIQPAADDSGGALGAALYASHVLGGAPRRRIGGEDAMKGARLGPAFSTHDVDVALSRFGAPSHHFAGRSELSTTVANALAKGQVVGYFSGRMEFGPRALGGRSILGDPRRQDMQRRMNVKIKNRESFRPFAPMVLAEHCASYFDLHVESPYMLLVAPVRTERRLEMKLTPTAIDDALKIVDQPRSDIPAVTHVNYSARVQTIDAIRSPEMHRLLTAFHEETGCPVLINTSFNVRDEPIVCSPQDAYRCFMLTDIDMLVLEDRVLIKSEQPAFAEGTAHNPGRLQDVASTPTSRTAATPSSSALKFAGAIFDDFIVPLAERERASGRPARFPLGPDRNQTSYFDAPRPYSMGSSLVYPGGGTRDGLGDALKTYWDVACESELADLAPRLKTLAAMLEKEKQPGDGTVDIFVYTMF